MDISVVVPFYNEKKYIEKCIRSLLFKITQEISTKFSWWTIIQRMDLQTL